MLELHCDVFSGNDVRGAIVFTILVLGAVGQSTMLVEVMLSPLCCPDGTEGGIGLEAMPKGFPSMGDILLVSVSEGDICPCLHTAGGGCVGLWCS